MIIVPVAKPICPALHSDQNNSALKLRVLDPCKQALISKFIGLDREELLSVCSTEKIATKMGVRPIPTFPIIVFHSPQAVVLCILRMSESMPQKSKHLHKVAKRSEYPRFEG